MQREQYLEVERQLWRRAGVEVLERFVHLSRSAVRVRIQEAGDGPPVLFVHGGPNSGSTWAPLVAGMGGFRCIVVDRPGTGLSQPLALDATTLPGFADGFVSEVLDACGLDRAHVVASSFGGYVALRSIASTPARVDAHVQLGCPAFAADMTVPPFMQAMLAGETSDEDPPVSDEDATVGLLCAIGHADSVQRGRIWPEFVSWYTKLRLATETFANDGGMLARLADGRRFPPELTPDPGLLDRVVAPTFVLWGADDPFGGVEVGLRLVRELPKAHLEVLPDGGHLPWLDDPVPVADRIASFLSHTMVNR